MTFILLVSLLNFAQGVIETNITASKSDTKIVGGEAVTRREDFPYQASVRVLKRHYCGGSIITSRHILTAAHCCFNVHGNPINDPRFFTVVVGDLNVKRPTAQTVVRNVVALKYHKDFSFSNAANDIAVMKLGEKFPKWNPFIGKIALAKSLPAPGTQCVVSGWGKLKEAGVASNILQMLQLPIMSRSKCIEVYHESVQDGMFCAGFIEGGKSVCKGDSGGPLACDGVLYGIVSWQFGCARPGYPAVYADVGYYRDWIIEIGLKENTASLHNKRSSYVLLFYILNYYILL